MKFKEVLEKLMRDWAHRVIKTWYNGFTVETWDEEMHIFRRFDVTVIER